MKMMEWILIGVAAVAALLLAVTPRRRGIYGGTMTGLLIVLIVYATVNQFRVHLLPTYILILVLLIWSGMGLLRNSRNRNYNSPSRSLSRRRYWFRTIFVLLMTVVFSAGSIVLVMLFPLFTMPVPTGSYVIGTFSQELVDESREETRTVEEGDYRRVMVNVWYPVDKGATDGMKPESYPSELGEAISLVFGIPSQAFSYLDMIPTHVYEGAKISDAQSQYPVVLFSPGVRSARFQSMTAVEELVSHGYIVVGMDHPYTSAKISFSDGSDVYYEADPEFATSEELYQQNVKGVGVRAKDASFVLDTLTSWNAHDPNGQLEGKLDLDHTGIFGHSYGGATTAEALAQDVRFQAGLSLEGGFWGKVAYTKLKQPFMYIMSGQTAESFDPDATEKDAVFYPEFAPDLDRVMTSSQNDTYYLTVDGFFHQSFTDISLIAPRLFTNDMTADHNVDITRSYTLAFFDHYLKGEEQPLLQGPSSRFPEASYDATYTKFEGQSSE